jgi:hypothetical protein
MNREQLAHVPRAAARLTGDADILVIGSQAILGTFDDAGLPSRAVASMEANLAFFADPDERKADEIDGSIGEDSMFHQTHGYYGQGVGLATATLPQGWRDRLVPFHRADADPVPGLVSRRA